MNIQKQDHPSIKVIVVGISGTGKTTLWEKIVTREKKAKYLFLFDHKAGDFARRFKIKPCSDVDELNAAALRGGIIIFDPSKHFAGQPEEGFRFFCKWVWEIGCLLPGLKIVGADELDDLLDTRNEPEALCKILDQGRTFQFDCYFIAQSMNGLHNQVRKQFTEIFAFAQGDKSGLEYLIGKGFNGQELLSLKYGEWLYKNRLTSYEEKGGAAFQPKNSSRNLKGL
jgi:hypothetical protein